MSSLLYNVQQSGSIRTGLQITVLLIMTFVAATAHADIDTISMWNGSSFISSFGVVNTATYGQIITVPQGADPMTSFSFEIGNCTAAVAFRGHVYAWNGTSATGPSLYDSGVQTVPASLTYNLVTFNTGSLHLPAGQYVLFASTSEDQGGAPPSACRWGALTNNTGYPGGQFVFENNGTDTTQWTGASWPTIAEDLAFRVVGLSVQPIPTLNEWGLILLMVLMGISSVYYLQRQKRVIE